MSKLNIVNRPNWTKNQIRDVKKLWLDKNENIDIYLSNKINSIIKKIPPHSIFGYPHLNFIYEKLSSIFKVHRKNLLICNGSDGGIRAIFDCFIKQSDKVLIPSPTFAMYDVYAKLFKTNLISFKYLLKNGGFVFDIDNFLKLIETKNVKLICLANPDSPSGTVLKKNEVIKIIKVAKKKNCIVLIDEAYYPFCNITLKSEINKYENLIIVRSLSKSWALAGLRIGYILSCNKNISYMTSSKPMYEIGGLQSHILSELIINKYNLDVEKSVKDLNVAKAKFVKLLSKLHKIEYIDTYSNFIHIKLGKNRRKIVKKIKKFAYIRDNQSKILKDYTRITITRFKFLKKIFDIIKDSYE